jgi:serine/threonine-protein kinase
MGEVYLAEDIRLGRKIALKLLPTRFTQDADRLRWFEKEAKSASGLNHPNIITIHDIGQVEGRPFIATEFIEGQTLRQKIAQQPMKVEDAIDIAIQAANALAAAHEAGVVHRDIKPENIMLRNDGYVKVLDFGLAKLIQSAERDEGADASTIASSVTATGTVKGTARYMSPEQVCGEKVDARSDIFSLGVVLYEMIVGKSPFNGATTADVFAAILEREPSLALPEMPRALESVIRKALHKDRDKRYQTAREMITDLVTLKHNLQTPREEFRSLASAIRRRKRSLTVAAVLLLLIATTFLYFRAPSDTIDTIAVLPFVDRGNEPSTEYLSVGLSDGVISGLADLSNLHVKSLSAVLPYQGKPPNPESAGRKLNVRGVVIGWFTLQNDLLSVTAELVDTRDSHVLWRSEFGGRKLSEVRHVQDEISRGIAAVLSQRLTREQSERLSKRGTKNSDAYALFMKGRSQWAKLTRESLYASIDYFEQAVAIDKNYALAYSGLADDYFALGEASYARPRDAFPKAKDYAEAALKIDRSLAQAWISRGIVQMFYDWDWHGAENSLLKARELSPNNADLHHFYGHYLEIMGRTAEAIPETKLAVMEDVLSAFISAELGGAYYFNRQYDLAVTQTLDALTLEPNFAFGLWTLAQPYGQQQQYQKALEVLNQAQGPSREWPWIVAEVGYINAKSGNRTEAQRIIRELKKRSDKEWIDPMLIAYIHIGLDEKNEAFRFMNEARDERSGLIPWLNIEPKFDPLRDDPRFLELLRRVKLAS